MIADSCSSGELPGTQVPGTVEYCRASVSTDPARDTSPSKTRVEPAIALLIKLRGLFTGGLCAWRSLAESNRCFSRERAAS